MIALCLINVMLDFMLKKTLEMAVLKQAVRDIASVNTKTSTEAFAYFYSKDFEDFCKRHDIDKKPIRKAVKTLFSSGIHYRKKSADQIAKLIDSIEE